MPALPSEKTITVKVENEWLNAMEDWIFCELSEEETEKSRKEMRKLWQALVDAYDKSLEKRERS